MTHRRTHIRQYLLQQFGGACQRCGYDRCQAALHFHHKDPSTKPAWREAARRRTNLAEVHQYPERFELLCANCHTEEHYQQARAATLNRLFGKVYEDQFGVDLTQFFPFTASDVDANGDLNERRLPR